MWKIFRRYIRIILRKAQTLKHTEPLSSKGPPKKNRVVTCFASFGWRFRRRWWCGGLRILQPTSIPLDISSICVWFTRKKKPGNLVAQNRQNPHKKDWKTFKSSTPRHPNTSAWTGRFASTHSLRFRNSSDLEVPKKNRHLWSTWIIFLLPFSCPNISQLSHQFGVVSPFWTIMALPHWPKSPQGPGAAVLVSGLQTSSKCASVGLFWGSLWFVIIPYGCFQK